MKNKIICVGAMTILLSINSMVTAQGRGNNTLTAFLPRTILTQQEQQRITRANTNPNAQSMLRLIDNQRGALNIPNGRRTLYLVNFLRGVQLSAEYGGLHSIRNNLNPVEQARYQEMEARYISNSRDPAFGGRMLRLALGNNENNAISATIIRAQYDGFRFGGARPNIIMNLIELGNRGRRGGDTPPNPDDIRLGYRDNIVGANTRIETNPKSAQTSVQVYSLDGKMVMSQSENLENFSVNQTGLNQGIYIVNVTSGNQIISSSRIGIQ